MMCGFDSGANQKTSPFAVGCVSGSVGCQLSLRYPATLSDSGIRKGLLHVLAKKVQAGLCILPAHGDENSQSSLWYYSQMER